jgi:glucoamylase
MGNLPSRSEEMDTTADRVAFGAPGIEPRWTSSSKDGLGTARSEGCRLWFTLSHGIVNEIYYPTVDQPNTRDFQFLISDGKTFCHEEKRDLDHRIEYPARNCLFYRLSNAERNGRYQLVKEVLTDSHRSVFLMHTKLEVNDESLWGKLSVYALLAPHLARYGANNSGYCSEISGNKLLRAERAGVHLVMGCNTGFTRRSVGYVGASDGWQDVMNHCKMEYEFCIAENGNIALTGEVDLQGGNEFTIGIGLGDSYQSAAVNLLQSLATPFDFHRADYIRDWQRTAVRPPYDFRQQTSDDGGTYRLSHCVLLAHEDKVFQGALIASMSIPWGETKGDDDVGGYHLVWTRDLVQSASALLASGAIDTPVRALIWLAAIQRSDGSFPQNSWIDGKAFWPGLQLDEVAAPILLAWRVHREGTQPTAFDPWVMVSRAARCLILQGPVTGQDRWEENAGYSPSTLATVIAGLVCAAEFAKERGETGITEFILAYADWLAGHLEQWTVTTSGELAPGYPRHYIRINPGDALAPDPHPDANQAMIQIANGGGQYPARNVVGGDFLSLVRLGIRDANDPLVRDSIKVIDQVIKHDLPAGPSWRRYNHDGYGQKNDGSAFDGTGVGRCWPLLTGERGHYELAAGSDPMPFITAMERFANDGGMITEQLWDSEDLPNSSMIRGRPTGAAMPLCWSHAEYIELVRSYHDGVCFDRIEPAFQRYVRAPLPVRREIWGFRYPIRSIPSGRILRMVVAAKATVVWSTDGWTSSTRSETEEVNALWFSDLPTEELPSAAVVEFTFYWEAAQRWEGRNWQVEVQEPTVIAGFG